MSEKAFNSSPWPTDNLSNKSNIPEGVEKSDDHAFFNIGYYCSGGLWSLLFSFDVNPVRLTIGNLG